jgi:hypothetical protein
VSLLLIAAIELLDALSSVQDIFTEYHHETASLRFAQGLKSIKLALSPLLAGATLFFRGGTRESTLRDFCLNCAHSCRLIA